MVTGVRLNSFLSNPQWSPEQEAEADQLCAEIEESLAAALYHTKITPEPFTEQAPVLGSGLVALRYPCDAILSIEGQPIPPENVPLPDPYRLFEHRLWRGRPSTGWRQPVLGGCGGGGGFYSTGSLLGGGGGGGGGSVIEVSYMAGWGAQPALVKAILQKAKTIFLNNNDDTMSARGTDAQAPPPISPEIWSEDELAALGVFRRLSGGA